MRGYPKLAQTLVNLPTFGYPKPATPKAESTTPWPPEDRTSHERCLSPCNFALLWLTWRKLPSPEWSTVNIPCEVPSCDNPIVDDALVCVGCALRLRNALLQVSGEHGREGLATDLDLAVSRQRRTGPGNMGRRSTETPLAYDQEASEAASVLRNTLSAWCRLHRLLGLTSETAGHPGESNRRGGRVSEPGLEIGDNPIDWARGLREPISHILARLGKYDGLLTETLDNFLSHLLTCLLRRFQRLFQVLFNLHP